MRVGPDIVVDEIGYPTEDIECEACAGDAEFHVDFICSITRIYLCRRHIFQLRELLDKLEDEAPRDR